MYAVVISPLESCGGAGARAAFFRGQHGAQAARRAAQAGEGFLDGGRVALVVDQGVVVIEFLARRNFAQGVDEDAAVFLVGFAIRFAGVVDPAGVVAMVPAIDHIAVGQGEIKSVVDGTAGGGGAAQRFRPVDAAARVFDDALARFDDAGREHAVAVDGGTPDLAGGRCAGFAGHGKKQVKNKKSGRVGFAVFGAGRIAALLLLLPQFDPADL